MSKVGQTEWTNTDLRKFKRRTHILITHVKPSHRSRIARQLRAIDVRRIELIQQGKTYRF